MQESVPQLEKKAIKLALNENWIQAVELNQKIIQQDSKNINALLRLGRAYLQLKDFSKAKKIFKVVLEQDPINKVAQKNYELAKSQKLDSYITKSAKYLLKEPGVTKETQAIITKKGFTANKLAPGQNLNIQILKTKVTLLLDNEKIAEISEGDIVKRLNNGLKVKAKLTAIYLKGTEKEIKILLSSSEPIFKAERQDIKPYVRKGSIEEPEIEIEVFDDIEEE